MSRAAAVLLIAATACGAPAPEQLPPAFSAPPPPAGDQVDRFDGTPNARVDVLFVVSPRASMASSREALVAAYPALIDRLVELEADAQIGVVSAAQGPDAGRLVSLDGVRFLTESDGVDAFADLLDALGTSESPEAGIDAAFAVAETLQSDPANVGFVRADSDLQIVFVSDGDDGSALSPAGFDAWAEAASRPIRAHGLLDRGDQCAEDGQIGATYAETVDATRGTVEELCGGDLSQALPWMGSRDLDATREFFLSEVPAADTPIVAEVERGDGTAWPSMVACDVDAPGCELVYDTARNSVTFLFDVPGPRATVTVRYALPRD